MLEDDGKLELGESEATMLRANADGRFMFSCEVGCFLFCVLSLV
jgi:hypothetical protein